ncbi:MAG: TolC family protein [Nitrospiria bacterium]
MTCKKTRRFLMSLGIIFALVSARSPVSAERIITLEEAYRSALERSEVLRIAREGLTQAEGEKKRALSALFPTVTADLSYLRRPDEIQNEFFGIQRPESDEEYNFVLDQPLYSGGRAMATFRKAKLGIRGEVFNLNQTKEDLLFNIALAYYETLKAENNVKIEEEEVKRLEAHRRNAEKRVEVGEETKTVLLRAEAALSGARAKLIRTKNTLSEAKDQLALLANIEGPFDLAVPPLIPLPDRLEMDWINTAEENRLDLKRRSINIDKAREDIRFAKGSFYPSLSLEVQYRQVDQNPVSPFLIQEDKWAVIKLSFPIFEGMLRTAELAQARSKFRQSVLIKERVRDEIAVEVRRSVLNLTTLAGEIVHLKDQVRFAREAFSLASRQFAVGLGTNLDVLDANATLLDAERQLSNITYDREIAILQLKKSAGLFSPLIE